MKNKKSMSGQEPDYVLHWPYVMAIVPYYDETNNTYSKVYYFDGKEDVYPCRCEEIVENLAVVFRTSLDVVRGRAGLRKGGRNKLRKVPIVLIKGFCLVPVKCREQVVPKSGTLGYLVYQYVEKVKPLNKVACVVLFKDMELTLEICQQKRTVQYQMNLADWLQKQRDAEEQHWQYEICIARKVMKAQIAKKKMEKCWI